MDTYNILRYFPEDIMHGNDVLIDIIAAWLNLYLNINYDISHIKYLKNID
jgi:hypothetical protein